MGRSDTGAGRGAVAAALAGGCALAAACTSSPVFPPAEQPLVGLVILEKEAVLTDAQTVVELAGNYSSYGSLVIPPRAVPAGTRVLVRLLRDVNKVLPGIATEDLWGVTVQILPTTLTFATPAQFTAFSFLRAGRQGGVLFADEADSSWQRRGTPTRSADLNTLSFPIDGPHLWSLEGGTLWDPSGTFVRVSLWCDAAEVPSPPRDTIELGGGSYVWTRAPGGAACAATETGRFAIAALNGVMTFTPAAGPAHSYYLDVLAAGFTLASYDPPTPECGAATSSQTFTRVAGGGDGGTPNADGGTLADGGMPPGDAMSPGDGQCAADAAARSDAGAD